MYALVLLNFICPFVMVLVGTILKRHPISNINTQNGYSTPIARKSQEHWDYAQSIAPGIYIFLGKHLFLIELLVSILLMIFKVSITNICIVGTCIGMITVFFAIYYTDSKIEEKFVDKQS